MKMMRYLILVLLILCATALLTGCSRRHTLKARSESGQTVTISYKNPPALFRAPHFADHDTFFSMYFNGDIWYNVEIASTEKWTSEVKDLLLIAASSNLSIYEPVYESGRDPLSFYTVTVMDIPDVDDLKILFHSRSCYCSGSHGYDFDFGNRIVYKVDKTEIVPDLENVLLFQSCGAPSLDAVNTGTPENSANESPLVLIADCYRATVATVGGDGYSEIVLYHNKNTDSYELHTYSKEGEDVSEIQHIYEVDAAFAEEVQSLIQELNFDQCIDAEKIGMTGAYYVIKYNEDDSIVRITSDELNREGMGAYRQVSDLLYSKVSDENKIK